MQQTVWVEFIFVCDLFDQISQLFIFIRVSITTQAYFEYFLFIGRLLLNLLMFIEVF